MNDDAAQFQCQTKGDAVIDLQGARILQVIPALDAGGAERTTIEISRAIVDANGKAMVASRGGRLTDELDAIGAAFFQLPVDRKNPLICCVMFTG